MNDTFRQARSIPAQADMAVDAGLRSFMVGVFNKMALGLALSGAIAFGVGTNEVLVGAIFGTPLRWVVMFAPLAILFGSMFMMRNPSPTGSAVLYWALVSTMGLSLSYIFVVYQLGSIATTFFATAAAFGGLALWGYTTKKDLTGFGSFLIMGVIGLIIAGIVNIFLQSPALHFAISAIGVLVFAGLTAFDTQRLKYSYYEMGGDARAMGVATNLGALSLYINFINLFQFLLSFLGNRE